MVIHVPTTDEYDNVPCPLPGCVAPLHLVRSMSRGLYKGDFIDAMVLDREDAHTETWQVECEEGHVILLPGQPGCPYGDDTGDEPCPHEGDFDSSDDYRRFHGHDLGRLHGLLEQMARASK